MNTTLSINSPIVHSYALYSSILLLKMLLMAILTAYRRLTNRAYCSTEDARFFGNRTEEQASVPNQPNPAVERVRSAHMNDMENIPVFVFISGLYMLIEPDYTVFNVLMIIFTVLRIVYTLVYAFREVPQPTRAICWGVGYIITIYMGLHTIIHFI